MYDTIKIYLDRTSVCGHWDIDTIAKRLANTKLKPTEKGYKYEGKIKELFVTLYDNGIYIEGSLPRYYYGNNVKTLTFEDTIDAINQLQKKIGLPIWRAEVKRLDFGRNLLLNNPTQSCLERFSRPSKIGRYEHDTSVRFDKKRPSRSVLIYDKLAKLKKKKEDLELYNWLSPKLTQTLLRCEVQLKQSVEISLKYSSVKLVHLMAKSFFRNVNDYWLNQVKSLPTVKGTFINLYKVPFESIDKTIYAWGARRIGLNDLIDYFENKRIKGEINSDNKSKKKKKILEAMYSDVSFEESESIEELHRELDFLHAGGTNENYKILDSLVF